MPVIKRTIWVVVGDGAGYRIFSCRKLGGPMELIREATSPEAKKRTNELGSDRPGRNQASPDQARHAFANKADWHQQAEQEVAYRMAGILNRAYEGKSFQRLLLVAPPRTLGDIRSQLRLKGLGDDLIELDKDLTHLSAHELKGYLGKNY